MRVVGLLFICSRGCMTCWFITGGHVFATYAYVHLGQRKLARDCHGKVLSGLVFWSVNILSRKNVGVHLSYCGRNSWRGVYKSGQSHDKFRQNITNAQLHSVYYYSLSLPRQHQTTKIVTVTIPKTNCMCLRHQELSIPPAF